MIIHVENFYNDVQSIFEPVVNLPFKSCLYGEELVDFYMVPQGIDEAFHGITNQKVKLRSDSGTFRKPYKVVHFENFDKSSLFVGVVALEDTIFRTHRHSETGSHTVTNIQENLDEFIAKNCFDQSKWSTIAEINLKAGSLILFKPWLWHSLDQKLVKVFYLEFPECVNVETVEPVAKDGSSEQPMTLNLVMENHAVS